MKAKQDYEKVLRDIELAKAERERFQTEDQPGYRQWLHATFGQKLTELRESTQKLHELEDLIEDVHDEYFFGGHRSEAKAYQEVKSWRENPTEPGADPGQQWADFEEAEPEIAEDLRNIFERMFQSAEDEADRSRNSRRNERRTAHTESDLPFGPDISSGRIKDLYRRLVRRLHPDHAGPLTEQHIEWWHQTQAAYQQGDLDRLELIFTLTEIDRGGTKDASVSLLTKITREFKKALKAIRAELSAFRQDPAWKFSTLKDRNALYQQTQRLLQHQLSAVSASLLYCQKQIDAWEETLRRTPSRKRGPKTRSARKEETWF